MEVWQRPRFQPGGDPGRVSLFCFLGRVSDARELLAGGLEVAYHGVGEGRFVELVEHLVEPHLVLEARRAGIQACGMFGRARLLAHVHGRVRDPADLRHLQAAWELARLVMSEHEGLAVFDAEALRWHAPRDLPGPEAPLELGRELKLEPWAHGAPALLGERAPDLLRTRGLAKFGRPDLVLLDPLGTVGDLGRARSLLLSAAGALARGRRLEPGQALPELGLEVRGPRGLCLTLGAEFAGVLLVSPADAAQRPSSAPASPPRGAGATSARSSAALRSTSARASSSAARSGVASPYRAISAASSAASSSRWS